MPPCPQSSRSASPSTGLGSSMAPFGACWHFRPEVDGCHGLTSPLWKNLPKQNIPRHKRNITLIGEDRVNVWVCEPYLSPAFLWLGRPSYRPATLWCCFNMLSPSALNTDFDPKARLKSHFSHSALRHCGDGLMVSFFGNGAAFPLQSGRHPNVCQLQKRKF